MNLTPFLLFDGNCAEAMRDVFDKLSAGADPDFPDDLRDLHFGAYGHLADKYGIHWFFQGDG